MIHTGYKLVRLPLNISIMAPPPYSKRYPMGEVVEADPNTLGLMLFESLVLAIDFIDGYNSNITSTWAVLEVEYDSNDIIIVDYISFYLDLDSLNAFYLKSKPYTNLLQCPPLGTLCCKKLKVISELKGELH